MNRFGQELRICPAKRPGVAFATVSLLVGGLFATLIVGLLTSSPNTSRGDIVFLLVTMSIFLGVGVLLLYRRQRTLKRALVYRVFEAGIVRETSSDRQELPFAELGRLLTRVLHYSTSGHRYTTIVLVSGSGAQMRLDTHSLDNVDESLLHLFEQRAGRRAEPLGR